MLGAGKASCCVANAYSTGSKVIWPRSNLKNHQNVQKTHFLRKVPGVNGLINMLRTSSKFLMFSRAAVMDSAFRAIFADVTVCICLISTRYGERIFIAMNHMNGHFRVTLCFCFKTRIRAKPFLVGMKMNIESCNTFPAYKWFHTKHSFWHRGKTQLESGLLMYSILTKG